MDTYHFDLRGLTFGLIMPHHLALRAHALVVEPSSYGIYEAWLLIKLINLTVYTPSQQLDKIALIYYYISGPIVDLQLIGGAPPSFRRVY